MEAIHQWYEIPDSWVDAVDIDEMGKKAIELLRDMIVKRPTEYGRFKMLFLRAMSNKLTLLPRQQKVLELAQEAKRLGVTETTYISDKLGINRFSAYKALRRAEDRFIVLNYQNGTKMETYDNNMAIRSEDVKKFELPMSDIDNMIKHQLVACPTYKYYDGCSGTAYVRLGLCPECHEHFKNMRGGEPEWVTYLRNEMRVEARKEARHALFVRKYGVDFDVSEVC